MIPDKFVANRFDNLPEERRKEIAANGGRRSSEVRRRKRSLREATDLYLSLQVKDRRTFNALVRKGLATDDIDNQMAIIVGLAKAAADGDAKAAKVIFDLLGEADMAGAEPSNLLDAIRDSSSGEVDTDDVPELEQAAAAGHDLVEPSDTEDV